jgi:prevent-host-death family protein
MKELKENLSAVVAAARAGESVLITDRGEPVAELRPISPERRLLEKMVAEGRATWSGRRPHFTPPKVVNTGPTLSDAVIEDRR